MDKSIYQQLKKDFCDPKLIDMEVDRDAYQMIDYETRKCCKSSR